MIQPYWLGLFYCASEIVISKRLRVGKSSQSTDRGSLRLIWTVVMVTLTLSFVIVYALPFARLRNDRVLYWIGVGLFVFFLALRWYAIYYLGRYFTVDVAIAADQRVIDTGPYRFIRHPSYLGAIGAFVGLGLTMNNGLSLAVLVLPIGSVFIRRIYIEEAALRAGLGDAYTQYMRRTYRLLPGMY